MPLEKPRSSVTVLIPVLNERGYIRQAVRSLQAQDYDGPLEFVFVDGGSTTGHTAVSVRSREPRPTDPDARQPPADSRCGAEHRLAATNSEYIVRMDAHALTRRATSLSASPGYRVVMWRR